MMLVAAFAAFALLFGAKEAVAQAGLSFDVYAAPTGNFLSPAEANLLLTSHVATLKNVLVTLTPGTNAFKTMERTVVYYSQIQAEIGSGKNIPGSISSGLIFVGHEGSGYGTVTKTELMTLRSESIDILSQ